MAGADLDAPRSQTVPSACARLPMAAVLPSRPDLPGTSPGQAATDMPAVVPEIRQRPPERISKCDAFKLPGLHGGCTRGTALRPARRLGTGPVYGAGASPGRVR